MIRYLRAKVSFVGEGYAIFDLSGIGIEVFMDDASLSLLKVGEEVTVHTAVIFGDEPKIYGFLEQEKREMFLRLLTVSKLGPKTALKMLSSVDVESLVSMIVSGDVEAISKLPGVGKKMAERIVAELKDSVSDMGVSGIRVHEAVEALKALGYTTAEALKAVREVAHEGMDVSEMVKKALSILMRRK